MVNLIQKALTQYAKDARASGIDPNHVTIDGVYPLEATCKDGKYSGLAIRVEGHLAVYSGDSERYLLFNRVYDVDSSGASDCFADYGPAMNEKTYGNK